MIIQGSPEWFNARIGKITASRMADVMARTKTGPGAARKNYMAELLCQRLTGAREDGYVNTAMQRGIDMEPMARSSYEMFKGVMVQEVGFINHPTIANLGASPDGLVNGKGSLEIKCPNTAQHIACIQSGKADPKYFWQMQTQMICAEREWCDFASFDDRLPEELQLFVTRVPLDPDKVKEMLEETGKFLLELDVLETAMRERMAKLRKAA
jgi:putative phage-type endonuclease